MLSFAKMATLCFLFTAPAVTASATEICKSIDEEGNVTFTDCQAVDSDSTRIEVSEGPTEAEILEAKERAKQEIDAFKEICLGLTEKGGALQIFPDSPQSKAGALKHYKFLINFLFQIKTGGKDRVGGAYYY